jgi:flagellar biosynthesis component FlhA
LLGDLIVPGDLILVHWSSVLLGAAAMVFSLLAYFLSMVTAFAVVMAALVGFGDSQMRMTRLPHYPAVSNIAGSDRDALTNVDKDKEAQKDEEARQAAEAQMAAEAREAAKKLARAKLAHERKQAALARQRQEREARDSALAWGYPGQYPGQYGGGSRLYSYAPGGFDR